MKQLLNILIFIAMQVVLYLIYTCIATPFIELSIWPLVAAIASEGVNTGTSWLQADWQNKKNIEFWNMQNAYNHPTMQMQRYKQAGLNPHLSVGGNVPAASVHSASPSPPRLNMSDVILQQRQQKLAQQNLELQNRDLENKILATQADIAFKKQKENESFEKTLNQFLENATKVQTHSTLRGVLPIWRDPRQSIMFPTEHDSKRYMIWQENQRNKDKLPWETFKIHKSDILSRQDYRKKQGLSIESLTKLRDFQNTLNQMDFPTYEGMSREKFRRNAIKWGIGLGAGSSVMQLLKFFL
jgi:hypothetical protein